MKTIFKIFLTILIFFNLLVGTSFAQTDEFLLEEDFQLENLGYSFDDLSMFQEPIETSYEKARVLDIKEKEIVPSEEDVFLTETYVIQEITLQILGGKFKNKEKIVENNTLYNPLGLGININDKVLVFVEEFEDGTSSFYIQDYWRLPSLMWLVVVFLLLLLAFGKLKGLKAILSLTISIFLIFKIFIPQILIGSDPIKLSLIISIIVTVVSLFLVSGFKKKSVAAILGTSGGLLIAAILAIIVSKISNLTGLSSEESRLLLINFPELNLQGLLFAGIIIGALGAVMDVGMSIASSIAEVKKAHPKAGFSKLFKSGISVGRDIMGTMTNTLIFAYVGVSLPLLLLFTNLGESYLKFLNFEFIAEEVVRSLAGSIGLIATLPLTALIAAYLESRKS